MTAFFTRLGVFLLWALHWLPLSLQAMIGDLVGWLAYFLTSRRRRVAQRNLELCFPEMSGPEIRRLVRRNFQASVRAVLEHGLLIWASGERLRRIIRVEGQEHLDDNMGEPLILLAPHFIGLDMAGARLAMMERMASSYAPMRNSIANHYIWYLRSRFNQPELVSRHDGIRSVIKIIRSGLPFYYLPDQDSGRREAIFVPFFGIPAATLPALSRLAKLTGAKVVPVVARQLPGGQGYLVKFYPAWENYPCGDVEADTRRMNAFIEDRIREMPEQYLWTHRRFKTRPEGEPGFY